MPITPWFGHDKVLAMLRKRVDGFLEGFHQNCALLGPEGVGKTTLVRRLLHQESKNAHFIGIYLEVQEDEKIPEWAKRFVRATLYSMLHHQGVSELPAGLTPLFAASRNIYPKTTDCAERLLALAEDAKAEELYDRLWDLPQLATTETGLPCLLILDEFDRLRSLAVKEPFHRFGRKVMVQSTTMYVVTSSQLSAARETLRTGLRLLFGQFETIEISSLDPSDSLQAIRSVWPEGHLSAFLEHLLVELSQGSAATLDLLLQGLLDRGPGREPKDQERSLLDLLEFLFLESGGPFRRRCETRLRSLPAHRNRWIWLEVLAAVAAGARRVSQIALGLDRSPAQIARALEILEKVGLVSKHGAFHRLQDRLFQLWMLTAFPVLQGMDLIDPAQARARFRDAAWTWMEGLRQATGLSMLTRTALFLKQWQEDVVEVEDHRIRLPAFASVEEQRLPAGQMVLVARHAGRAGRDWLVIPWLGPLDEVQARQWVQEIQGSPMKDLKRLFAGASPVELHARLILQEARIRLWDLRVFNDLLDLYGLTRIPHLRPDPQGVPDPMIPLGLSISAARDSNREGQRAG